MTQLMERLALPPYKAAWEYLNRSICQVSDFQEPDTMQFRVPFGGGESGPALTKDVVVEYRKAAGSSGQPGRQPWGVRWKPADGGPFPEFAGRLYVEESADGSRELVLEGEYEPPLGAAGRAFDAVVGMHIASVTAQEFLRTVAVEMKREHALNAVDGLP